MLFERLAPALHLIEPERAHRLSLRALRMGLHSGFRADDTLAVEVSGLRFAHPLGLAAGYDKDGEAVGALWACGFSHVEVGTVTPRPQPGNARPRVFRLSQDRAVINRYGFNSAGAEAVRARLERLGDRRGILGVNIGANKDSVGAGAAAMDYVTGVETFGPLADYLTVNISSPNTAGLRDLQGDPLADLLARVLEARERLARHVPIWLKIAPDLDAAQMDAIAKAAEGVDALVVSNTTVTRPGLASPHAQETGGLSGRPLFGLATRTLAAMRERTALPLVGVGGVEDTATAWAKIEAGASLVQLYTALVYRGPGLVREIVTGLKRSQAGAGNV